MKTSLGLFLLVIVLVAASGCTTQQAVSEVTPIATAPVSSTEVPTLINTPLPTAVPTIISTTVAPDITTVLTAAATPTPRMTASTKITTIHIRNNTFVPAELIVLPGTGITWVNDDSVTHIVKASGDAKGKFTSAELITGARFGYTFGETTGTYEFVDPNYPDMKGAIIIKKGETLWIATGTSVTSG
jgi:plastocyanin